MTTKRQATIAHNETALNAMLRRQHAAVRAGAVCPVCGGGVNPTILEAWGHCLACQNATVGR